MPTPLKSKTTFTSHGTTTGRFSGSAKSGVLGPIEHPCLMMYWNQYMEPKSFYIFQAVSDDGRVPVKRTNSDGFAYYVAVVGTLILVKSDRGRAWAYEMLSVQEQSFRVSECELLEDSVRSFHKGNYLRLPIV